MIIFYDKHNMTLIMIWKRIACISTEGKFRCFTTLLL